jgi:hypothetical protein
MAQPQAAAPQDAQRTSSPRLACSSSTVIVSELRTSAQPGQTHRRGRAHGLAVALSAANVHHCKLLEPLVDAVAPIRRAVGQPGRPRFRPAKLHGDKSDDFDCCRQALRRRGITPRIARRGITPRIARRGVEPSERLGRYRWVVERTNSWLLACALICLRFLDRAEEE